MIDPQLAQIIMAAAQQQQAPQPTAQQPWQMVPNPNGGMDLTYPGGGTSPQAVPQQGRAAQQVIPAAPVPFLGPDARINQAFGAAAGAGGVPGGGVGINHGWDPPAPPGVPAGMTQAPPPLRFAPRGAGASANPLYAAPQPGVGAPQAPATTGAIPPVPPVAAPGTATGGWRVGLGNAAAGLAGVDPTQPGLTAFAQGFAGAQGKQAEREEAKRKEQQLSATAEVAAEEKTYQRGRDIIEDKREDEKLRLESVKLRKEATTDDIDEYRYAQQGGYEGSFTDFLLMKKAEGIDLTLGTDETSFAKAAGAQQAERFSELAQSGLNAGQMISDVTELRTIAESLNTGKTTEIMTAIGPWAEAMGMDIEGLDEAQAYKAIIARIAPSLRVPGSGTTSDIDIKLFLQSLPSLGSTPEGNALVQDTLEALAESKQRAGEIASMALSAEITPAAAEKMLRELPDPMKAWRASRGKVAPKAGTEGGAGGTTLPSGGSLKEVEPGVFEWAPAGPQTNAAPPLTQPAAGLTPPIAGAVEDGWTFIGGDPADPKSWSQVA